MAELFTSEHDGGGRMVIRAPDDEAARAWLREHCPDGVSADGTEATVQLNRWHAGGIGAKVKAENVRRAKE